MVFVTEVPILDPMMTGTADLTSNTVKRDHIKRCFTSKTLTVPTLMSHTTGDVNIGHTDWFVATQSHTQQAGQLTPVHHNIKPPDDINSVADHCVHILDCNVC